MSGSKYPGRVSSPITGLGSSPFGEGTGGNLAQSSGGSGSSSSSSSNSVESPTLPFTNGIAALPAASLTTDTVTVTHFSEQKGGVVEKISVPTGALEIDPNETPLLRSNNTNNPFLNMTSSPSSPIRSSTNPFHNLSPGSSLSPTSPTLSLGVGDLIEPVTGSVTKPEKSPIVLRAEFKNSNPFKVEEEVRLKQSQLLVEPEPVRDSSKKQPYVVVTGNGSSIADCDAIDSNGGETRNTAMTTAVNNTSAIVAVETDGGSAGTTTTVLKVC